MPDSQRPIDLTKQLFASTLPKYGALIALVVSLTLGFTKMATTDYVDVKLTVADKRIAALAEAQTVTARQVKKLAESDQVTDKRMKLVVALVAAQYMDHADEEAASPQHAGKPRSRKTRAMAAALKINPDDPLAGLELLAD